MKYIIKQKVFSLTDSYTIKDENNIDSFSVKSEFFTVGKKLRLFDMKGEELAFIQQKLFKLLPTYNIYQKDVQVASVKKEFTFLKPKFTIEADKDKYTIEGNIFSHEFLVMKNEGQIGRVSKEWFAFSDSYGVEIDDKENHALILALVIVLDAILYNEKN